MVDGVGRCDGVPIYGDNPRIRNRSVCRPVRSGLATWYYFDYFSKLIAKKRLNDDRR